MTRDPIPSGRRLLVVDDDPVTRDFVQLALTLHDFDVDQAPDASTAMALVRSTEYDAVILDVELPTCSGIALMKEIRRIRDVPILMLTAHDDSAVCVIALECGADAFCTKPIVERELALRVDMAIHHRRSRLRAAGADDLDPSANDATETTEVLISAGDLTIDVYCRIAILERQALDLTAKEFDLLVVLARHPGRVFTRVELLEQVWDAKPEWQSIDTVTEHVYRLRQKLDAADGGRSWIQTLRGAGYRFDPQHADKSELETLHSVG